MVNLEEARYWQESARDWWRLAKEPCIKVADFTHNLRMREYQFISRLAREYMGITDQDQLYALGYMMEPVKAGKLFVISSGEYSDYHYNAMFLALRDVTSEVLKEASDKAVEKHKSLRDSGGCPDIQNLFIAELVIMGIVVDVDFQEIHIGTTMRLEIDGVCKHDGLF